MVGAVEHPGTSSCKQHHKECLKGSPHHFLDCQCLCSVSENCTQEGEVLLENSQSWPNSCISYIVDIKAFVEDGIRVKEDKTVGCNF